MLRPTVHAALEEGAVDDELTATLEQVEQARFALGPVERICLFHGNPRHPPSLGGQRVTGAGQGLLLHEQLLARSLPLLPRHDLWCKHGGLSVFSVSLMCRHYSSLSWVSFEWPEPMASTVTAAPAHSTTAVRNVGERIVQSTMKVAFSRFDVLV